MLVVSSSAGEILIIGNNIKIRLLDVSGNQVRIGITAPKNVAVDREEVYLRKCSKSDRSAKPPEVVFSGNKNAIRVIRKKSPLSRLYGRHNT